MNMINHFCLPSLPPSFPPPLSQHPPFESPTPVKPQSTTASLPSSTPVITLPLLPPPLLLLREGSKKGEEGGEEGLILWRRCCFGRMGRRWEKWPQQHRWVGREGGREGGRKGRDAGRGTAVCSFIRPSLSLSFPPCPLSLQLTAEAIYDYSEAAAPAAPAPEGEEQQQQEGSASHSFPEGTKLDEGVNPLPSSSLRPSLPPLYAGGRSPSDLFYSEHVGDVHSLLEKTGADSYVERMDLEDYLFRFDRGVFWLAQVSAMLGFFYWGCISSLCF